MAYQQVYWILSIKDIYKHTFVHMLVYVICKHTYQACKQMHINAFNKI